MAMSVTDLKAVLRAEMSKLKMASSLDKVHKDECMFSFDSPYSTEGLFVNLESFQGFGRDFVLQDHTSSGCKLYLHEKWNQVPKPPTHVSSTDTPLQGPTKLAIGVEGGFVSGAQFDVVKNHCLVVITPQKELISFPLPEPEIPEFVANVIQSVIDHNGMASNMQVNTWDADNEKFVSKYAASLIQINPSGKKIPQDPKQWVDEATGATENLWLNLSTGYIGGGRKNWDGSGGSGSALDHYNSTGKIYPLAVKLGTITPHGADVWCYADDEDALVIDPLLADHLSFWGIDVMKLEKTEKTMSEMEVSLNMSYDWSKIMDGQEELELVRGAGFVGLRNIGSSCYLNATMQVLLAIPEVQERYLQKRANIVTTAPSDPSQDLITQLSKLAAAVLTDRYVPADDTATNSQSTSLTSVSLSEESADAGTLERYVVAPRMFKHVIGKGHPEFSSGRQQDSSEYFQYFLELLGRAERVGLSRVSGGASKAVSTPSIFEFYNEIRYQCPESGDVKYVKQGPQTLQNMLEIPIPKPTSTITESGAIRVDSHPQCAKKLRVSDAADALATAEHETDPKSLCPAPEEEAAISFESCLKQAMQAEQVEMYSPSVGHTTKCVKTVRFKTYPRYLMVKMGRYYVGSNWVQQKINTRVDVPESLDLTSFCGTGPKDNETLMPEDASTSTSSAAGSGGSNTSTTEFVVDEGLVVQLTSMGFSENGSRRAAIATNNADADTAMNWVFAHMEDPDFNDPPPLPTATSSTGTNCTESNINAEAQAMLSAMGYTADQANAALKATNHDIERAADWLFSHADDLDACVAEVLGQTVKSTVSNTEIEPHFESGEGHYTLMAVISHLGKNTDHGHYICHLKKGDSWVLFNDEKVGKAKSAPLGYGFMYLYRRNDGPGTFSDN